MNTLRAFLLFAALALSSIPASAGFRVQYFVGYGLYPPVGPFTPDPSSTTPGTGLLAVNGSHRTLIQLLSAGPNLVNDGVNPANVSGGYAGGDDVVLDSRIIAAGVDGVDEWGYTATPPPPFVSTNSSSVFLFVRVHQDATPPQILDFENHWTYDSPLIVPADIDSYVPNPPSDTLATVIHIETGGETVPAQGVALDRTDSLCLSCPYWTPDPPADPEIKFVEFNTETAGIALNVPYSYTLNAVYGADTALPGGGWDWKLLTEGADYTVTNGVVTLVTTGDGLPKFRIVRLGLIHDF